MLVIKNKSFLFALKFIITIGICAAIIWNVDWKETWRALQQTNPIMICIVFAGMILNVMASTLKWKVLLSIHEIRFSFNQLYKYYFTASFFNNFLPSTIGGDSYRIYKTFNNPASRAGAVTAVFLERLTGILALLLVGLVGGVIGYVQTGDHISRLIVIGGTAGFGFLIILTIAAKVSAATLKRLTNKIVPKKIQHLLEHLKDYRYQQGKIVMVIGLSFFFQAFLIIYRLLLVYAVGASISFASMAVIVAISTIIALIPISINGYGLLDGSFIYLLMNFNVSYEQAFIVMILIRLLNLPLALIGGIFYFFDKKSLGVDRRGIDELKNRPAV